MDRATVSFLLFLILGLTCMQCTVEKRLYNKGWSVEKRTHWKRDKAVSESVKQMVDKKKSRIAAFDSETDSLTTAEETTSAPAVNGADSIGNVYETPADQLVQPETPRSAENEDSLKRQKEIQRLVEKEDRPGKSRTKGGNATGLLIAGVLLFWLLLGLVGLIVLIAQTTGLEAIGYFILAYFLGMVVLLVFIVFIVLLIQYLVANSRERSRKVEDAAGIPEEERKSRKGGSGGQLMIFAGFVVVLVLLLIGLSK